MSLDFLDLYTEMCGKLMIFILHSFSSLEETDDGEQPGNKRQKTETSDTQEIMASIETGIFTYQ